ncbi:MAG: ABC transporter ATP-binding protein [Bacteroidetes bacterium]|nr:ABC transporter ATP-binding protein [Bacteroidota bacterium]
MDLLLDIQNLEIKFSTGENEFTAVKKISFSLHKGETIGVVGESGSGKSVTSLSIMQLIPSPPGKISGGTIDCYGRGQKVNLLALNEKEMRSYRGKDIAMIFQEPMTSLNPVFTCGDQIVEAILLHQKCTKKEAKDKTIALFKEVQLPRPENIFDAFPHQLSGGQKQRVMIAMALSCEPSVLIADEPTTALDVTVQKTILELISSIQKKRNMGIIFITHDLGVVAEIADRAIVMHQGKIVEENTVKNLFQNPQHPYTKGLLACKPPLDKRYQKLPTVSDFLNGSSFQSVEITPQERKENHHKLYAGEAILQVKNLKTYFPLKKNWLGKTTDFVKAVDDVSFNVYKGETLGLVGESGCGKTTLGRTILRLAEATEGEIIYKGTDLISLSEKELIPFRKKMQIIFQDPYSSLNPRIPIGKAIMEPMNVHGILKDKKEREEYVINLLEKVSLKADHFYRYPHEFSGGQRQRICIARALAMQPEFIVCDESVSSLDVSVQAQVLNLLNDLKREFALTYIFISHDLSVVKFMCDRMIVMNKSGKIERMDEADAIYNDPQTEYVHSLIDAIPKTEF